MCGTYNFSASTVSMTDSAGNTYAAYGSQHAFPTVGGFTQTFYFGPLASSITTTTANSTAGSFLSLACQTATNIAASSPTDGQAAGDASTSPVTAGPITTTVNGDYIFCPGVSSAGDAFTPQSGFTGGSSFASNSLVQYAVQSTAGAITPSMAMGGTQIATMTCSAFKP